MSFTEFYANASTGSNLNAGSGTGAATFSVTGKNWDGTSIFTTTGSNLSAITVGEFASPYIDGASVAVAIGRVTAVDDTLDTITLSTTAKSGTYPAVGVANRSINVGGVLKGPNAAEAFPFNFAAAAMTNAAGDMPRINFKNNSTYAITAAMTHSLTGAVRFEGYTTSAGDGGRATIDGTLTGASYVLLTLSGSNNELQNLVFANNGTTGANVNVEVSGARNLIRGCVSHDSRAAGFSISGQNNHVVESETYLCNTSNTNGWAGMAAGNNGNRFIRCISHDNAGSNTVGFIGTNQDSVFISCIADTNGSHGFYIGGANHTILLSNCDAYNNTGDGMRLDLSSGVTNFYIENCNFIKNGGYGINGVNAGTKHGRIVNCGFGAGTQANTSGTTNGLSQIEVIGSITYASDVTPWVDPANGDFRINLAAAKGAGRGTFTQTAASYAGTVGYPDIGSAQHLETATPRNVGVKTGGRL